MKKRVFVLVFLVLIILTIGSGIIASITEDNNHILIEGEDYVSGEIIVKYKPGFSGNGNEIIGKNEIIIYEYLDNLASSLNDLETEVQRIDNELFKIEKALKQKSSKYWN